jgi:predicted nicotinamide N-methyase
VASPPDSAVSPTRLAGRVSIGRTTTDIGALPVPAGVDGVEHSSIDLAIARIDIAHPRDVVKIFYELNFGADGEDPPYWAKPWPCGVELARVVAGAVPAGSRVLELGCGLALPSMAAGLAGAHVLATDQASDALAFADYNARRNHIPLDVATCDWTDPVVAVAGAPWDFVLAADVLYRHSGLDALHALLPRLVGSTGEIWIADQARPPAHDFLAACRGWATITTAGTANPEVTIHRLRPRRRSGMGSGPVKRRGA